MIMAATVYVNSTTAPLGPSVGPPADINLDKLMGEGRLALSVVIPVTVIYVLLFVTGTVGNASTCVVIAQHRYMQTSTNYYLFSLAVSDLLLLVFGLPSELFSFWQPYPFPFGEVFCVLRGFVAECSTNASILTIAGFTVERYMAICHPMTSHGRGKLRRAVRVLLVMWLGAALCAIPLVYQYGIAYEYINVTTDNDVPLTASFSQDKVHHEYKLLKVEDSALCTIKTEIPHAFEISTFLFFLVPMTIITVLYLLIALELKRVQMGNRYIPPTNGQCSTTGGSNSLFRHNNQKQKQEKKGAEHVHREHSIELLNLKKVRTHHLVSDGDAGTQGESQLKSVIVAGKTSGSLGNVADIRARQQAQARKAVLKMLVAVVVAFFLCYAPFHAQRLMFFYAGTEEWTEQLTDSYYLLTYVSGVMYYVGPTVNPLLYNIMSLKFRIAFRDTLTQCHKWRCSRNGMNYSCGGGAKAGHFAGGGGGVKTRRTRGRRHQPVRLWVCHGGKLCLGGSVGSGSVEGGGGSTGGGDRSSSEHPARGSRPVVQGGKYVDNMRNGGDMDHSLKSYSHSLPPPPAVMVQGNGADYRDHQHSLGFDCFPTSSPKVPLRYRSSNPAQGGLHSLLRLDIPTGRAHLLYQPNSDHSVSPRSTHSVGCILPHGDHPHVLHTTHSADNLPRRHEDNRNKWDSRCPCGEGGRCDFEKEMEDLNRSIAESMPSVGKVARKQGKNVQHRSCGFPNLFS